MHSTAQHSTAQHSTAQHSTAQGNSLCENHVPKSRIIEIDCLKGIGIILVVLQHCLSFAGEGYSKPSIMILSFHMPLFFFASGIVCSPKDAKDLFAKRMAALLALVFSTAF